MKKYLLVILVLIVTGGVMQAQTGIQSTMSAVEKSIFGYDYSDETDSKRIERIENYFYGQKKGGDIAKRLENIQNDTGFTVKEEKMQSSGIEEKNDPASPQNVQRPLTTDFPDLKEDSTVEYPMVDKMEQEIFQTTYKNENIYKRLNRLEEKVFNKTSDDDLNTRVDRLSSVLKPSKRKPSRNNYAYSASDMNAYYGSSTLEPISDQSIPFQLAALEEDILKNSYMNDNISNRLSRIEQKLFNRTFASDTDITRLQRIMAAYDAKKNSYKYENNRKMQNMAAISQIGGILLMILAILL